MLSQHLDALLFPNSTNHSQINRLSSVASHPSPFSSSLPSLSALPVRHMITFRQTSKAETAQIAQLKAELATLLRKRILPPSLSHAYPTRFQDHDILTRYSGKRVPADAAQHDQTLTNTLYTVLVPPSVCMCKEIGMCRVLARKKKLEGGGY